jgi:hypothetical protein
MHIDVGIITISDRASRGLYDDLGGPALKKAAEGYDGGHGGSLTRRDSRGGAGNFHSGIAGVWGNHADRVDEDHEERDFVTKPGGGGGEGAGNLFAGQAERRGGVPGVCGGSDSALRGGVAGSADELLADLRFAIYDGVLKFQKLM